jgi:putative spermidine/putrescine transport system permease protein
MPINTYPIAVAPPRPVAARFASSGLLALLPFLLVLGGLFGGGMLLALLASLGTGGGGELEGLSPRHYIALAGDREFLAALGFSVWVASAATALSLLLGISVAAVYHQKAKRPTGNHVGNGWQYTLLQFPLAVPHLSFALVVLHLLSPSGIASRWTHAAGLIAEPAEFPVMVQDGLGIGIIVAYVWKEAPFVAVVALAMLARVPHELGEAAQTLGASPLTVWRRVYLPLISPAVIAAALAAFAYVFGAYETPLLLGRTYPAMLGVLAERRFRSVDLLDQPGAIAIALTISAVAGLLVWLYLRLARHALGERPVLF